MVSDGTRLRDEFLLDPSVTFLNHGSFGATPRAVFERYQEWQLELERQPVLFLARRLDVSAERGARFRGCGSRGSGLRPERFGGSQRRRMAFRARAGRRVLSTDLEYGALDLEWEHACGATLGFTSHQVAVTFSQKTRRNRYLPRRPPYRASDAMARRSCQEDLSSMRLGNHREEGDG